MYARLSTWNYNYIHKNNIVYQRLNEDFDTVLRLDQIWLNCIEWIISPV